MDKLATKSTFLGLCAISLLAGWTVLSATFSLALHDDQYTHILLVLPISAVLIWLEKPSWWPLSAANLRVGLVLLFAAVVVAALARWGSPLLQPDEQVSVGMVALVTWWIGSSVLCVRTQASQELRFPLCFLFWLVPFPPFLLTRIVSLLQQGSAVAAALLFRVAGVPVIRDGVLLSIPGLDVEVATECSSIRSSLMLIVTTMVLAHLLLRSPWRKTLLVAAALPLSVAKNGLRIFTIAVLATKVDPEFLNGRLHHQGGIVFFLVALAAIAFLVWALRRGEREV